MNLKTQEKELPPVVIPDEVVAASQSSPQLKQASTPFEDKADSDEQKPDKQPQEAIDRREQLDEIWHELKQRADSKIVVLILVLLIFIAPFLKSSVSTNAILHERLRLANDVLRLQFVKNLADLDQVHQNQLEDLKRQQESEKESLKLAFDRAEIDLLSDFDSFNKDIDEKMRKFVDQNFKADFQKEPQSMLKGIVQNRKILSQLVALMPNNVNIGRLVYNSSSEGLSRPALDRKVDHLKEALCVIKTVNGEMFGTYLSLVPELKKDNHFIFYVKDDDQVLVDRQPTWRDQLSDNILEVHLDDHYGNFFFIQNTGTVVGPIILDNTRFDAFTVAKMEVYEVVADI